MRLLLNTIMLEPNRWAPDHTLTWPLVDLLSPVSAAGYSELEIWQYHLSGLDRRAVEGLAGALGAAGLTAGALGAYPILHGEGAAWEQGRDQLEKLVDFGRLLGIEALKVFPGRVASADADRAVWRQSVERLRWLADLLAPEGALLTMETHGNTLCDTLDSALRLLGDLEGCDNIGICFQPYTDADTDAALAAYDALRDHVRHIHLQNRRLPGRATTLLAEGDWTDYRRLLPHVRRSGFDGLFCLEFTADITPPDGAAFDLQRVIDNAARDRTFAMEVWEAPAKA